MPVLRFWRNWRRNQNGNATVELILVVPMMALVVALTVSAYGFFKAASRDAKSSWAIADAISRETRNINPDFMTTLGEIQRFVTESRDLGFRISIVDFSPYGGDHYRIRWSKTHASEGMILPDVTIDDLTSHLPKLAYFETVIVVQTYLNHYPFRRESRLDPFQFRTIAVTRPRNGPQICWSEAEDPTSSTRTC